MRSHLPRELVRIPIWSAERSLAYLGYLGITIDNEVNDATHGDEAVISTPDSKVKVCVIPTNEELAIARETVALVNNGDQTGSAVQKMENERQIRLENTVKGKNLTICEKSG